MEELDGDNMWFNETTNKKEKATKQFMFWSLPPILVICIKRFTPHGKKLHTFVDFPLENLNLSSYVVGYTPNIYNYDLFGVCNHMGTTMGGHYNAFVKNMLTEENNAKWICYDDSQTRIIENPQSIVTPMAYCLFYRRKNIIA
jgi:ubiquitin carboxyl-terminal hydrolase 4/11/15